MRRILFFKYILLFAYFVYLHHSHAQDYTQLGLPEGAIARLGRGGEVNQLYILQMVEYSRVEVLERFIYGMPRLENTS